MRKTNPPPRQSSLRSEYFIITDIDQPTIYLSVRGTRFVSPAYSFHLRPRPSIRKGRGFLDGTARRLMPALQAELATLCGTHGSDGIDAEGTDPYGWRDTLPFST